MPRQNRGGHKAQADLPHLLAKARHFLVSHRHSGLGGDVPRRGAGAAGGQDQGAARVHQFDQGLADEGLFIRNKSRLKLQRVLQGFAQPLLQGGQAFVFVNTAGSTVADGDNADAYRV